MGAIQLSIQRQLEGNVDEVCDRLAEAIKGIGFGILTRIDFDKKIEEKLNEKVERCVILGACNPRLALEAYRQSTDVALLIPCNIVVRAIVPGQVVVEAMRPTMMLDLIKNVQRSESIEQAEKDLQRVISAL